MTTVTVASPAAAQVPSVIMATRRAQLVCQHLEGASAKLFEQHAGIIRDYMRGRHGVYALYKKDRLYYVGLAKNLRARLKQHKHDRHHRRWDRFSIYLVIDHKHIKELETLVLRMVKPKGNKQLGRFVKSENLKSRLSRDLRRRQQEEHDHLLGKKRRKSTRSRPKRQRRDASGALGPYITTGFPIRAKYKGKIVRARVLKNGWVRYGEHDYKTPSGAGRAVLKRTISGWNFWKYQRSPGEWVSLQHLRK